MVKTNTTNEIGAADSTRPHKVRLLGLLLLSIGVLAIPVAGKAVIIAQGRVTRNSWFFVVLPLVGAVLMLAIVFVVSRSSRVFPGLRLPWIGSKKRSTLVAAILLPIVVLAVRELLRHVLYRSVVVSDRVLLVAPFGTAFLIALIVVYCFIGPVAEEVFWRGYIQQGLERLVNGSVAVVVQALAFAALHLQDMTGTLVLFVFGVLCGLWRWRMRTLLPIVMVHMAWNAGLWIRYWPGHADVQNIRATHDYWSELEALSRESITQGEEENAWPHYVRATALMVEAPAAFDRADLLAWPASLSGSDRSALQACILNNAEALSEFELGAQKAYCLRDYTRMSPREIAGMPVLIKCHTLSAILLARAKRNQIDAHLPQMISDLNMCFRFSDQLQGPKPANELLWGARVRLLATYTAVEIAAHAKDDEACLNALNRLCRERRTQQQPNPICFAGQRIVLLDRVQGLFTDDRNGDGHIPLSVIGRLMDIPSYRRYDVQTWSKLRRRETVQRIDELFAYLEAIEGSTPFELFQSGRSIYDGFRESAGGNVFLVANADELLRAYFLATSARAAEDGLMVIVAVLRYRLENGHPPEGLDELVREHYLDDLPLDPYGGSPFIYRRVNDDFVLYNLGPDCDDDGGASNAQSSDDLGGDVVLWPLEESKGAGTNTSEMTIRKWRLL